MTDTGAPRNHAHVHLSDVGFVREDPSPDPAEYFARKARLTCRLLLVIGNGMLRLALFRNLRPLILVKSIDPRKSLGSIRSMVYVRDGKLQQGHMSTEEK